MITPLSSLFSNQTYPTPPPLSTKDDLIPKMIFEIMGYIFCLISCKKKGRKGEISEEKRDGVGTISENNGGMGTFSEKKI